MKQINKKTILISIILILIIASTVIISLNLKSDKKGNIEIAYTNSKSQVTSLSDQIIDKSKASTNSSVNDNKYKFTYTTKKIYTKKSDVDKELDKLYTSYFDLLNNHADNMTDEIRKANDKYFDTLSKDLTKIQESLTYNKSEKKSLNEYELIYSIDRFKSDIIMYTSDDVPSMLARAKECYKKAIQIKKDYDSGKITLEEAIKQSDKNIY